MIVNGFEVPREAEAVCIKVMHESVEFRASDIEQAAQKAGVPHSGPSQGLCGRIADRLIQRERKAKRIKATNYPYWQWVRK